MIEWDAARIAAAAGARLVYRGRRLAGGGREHRGVSESDAASPSAGPCGPERVVIDSRQVRPRDLFVGLPGERVDGGSYAADALRAGAWGVLVAPDPAARACEGVAGTGGPAAGGGGGASDPSAAAEGAASGAILAHPDPLAALQALARAWRRSLAAKVVAITGSTGKTSTKDILAAVLSRELRTAASPQNLNTEIGLPLAVLAAPAGTEALVLELAMRGPGQIAELVVIAEPDVGVIVNVGPVHLELLGSIEAIAAAKAELIAGLAPGATVVIPAGESLLAPHLRSDLRTVTFGDGGDVEFARVHADTRADTRDAASGGTGAAPSATAAAPRGTRAVAPREHTVAIVEHAPGKPDLLMSVEPSFSQSHNLRNLLAAVAAARALGVTPGGTLEVTFSALRGERIALADGIVLINDCYNANPMSMRAALDDLAATAPARRVAVLGDMLELGDERGPELHRDVAAYASACGVELLLAVGPQAAEMGETFVGEIHLAPHAAAAAEVLAPLLRPRDTVLVKGSRGVGLERVAETLLAAAPVASEGYSQAPEVGQAATSPAARAPVPRAPAPRDRPGGDR